MKLRESSSQPWYNSRVGALVIALVAVVLLYPVGLRAIDTGSLQQYSVIVALFVVAAVMLHRVVHKQRGNPQPAGGTRIEKKGHGKK